MRTERDSMGEMLVPDDALYGASTQRAVLNFPISGHRMPQGLVRGLALVKFACAAANAELGLMTPVKSLLIQKIAQEIMGGGLCEQFPVDVFQTGSGTSTNTNMNEVISNRACEIEGTPAGSKKPVHPNDDVNLGQSSNDVMPTALHVSVSLALSRDLYPSLEHLHQELTDKSRAFESCVKIGRTHLMDATPLTLGQEFSGYAMQVRKAMERTNKAVDALHEIALGGTSVGTGLNSHAGFTAAVCRILHSQTGLAFVEARNHFEAQAGRDDAVEAAGHLVTITAGLSKIANDIRLLGSGPRCGLGELHLPGTQPGSSMMPGKVNPVMCEMLVQVCHYAQGLSQIVAACGRDGHLELNATIPLIAYSLHEAIHCLATAARVFADACVHGIEADRERCSALVERSLMLITALSPQLGYDQAAAISREAVGGNRSVRELVLEKHLMDETMLDRLLDPLSMTRSVNAPSGVSEQAGAAVP